MSSNNSFDSPVKSQRQNGGNESFGEFVRPKPNFSPVYTSSPRDVKNNSPDFIPLGFSSPVRSNRGRGGGFGSSGNRGRWKDKSFSSNSSYSGVNSSFSPSIGPCNSRSTPYGSMSRHRGRRNMGNSRDQSRNMDMNVFYDHSMVEDPWAELEEKLRTSGTGDTVNSDNTSSSKVLNIDDVHGTDHSVDIIEETH